MIKMMSKYSFLLFLGATLVMTSCDDDDDEAPTPTPTAPTQNIAELAIANPQFSILVEALTAANLVDAVSDEGAALTVFAPNNTAFNTFFDDQSVTDTNGDGSRVDDAIADLGADAVTQLLLYHVIGEEIPASAVTDKMYRETSSTLSPSSDALSILVEPANSTVLINGGIEKGATVITPDISATNGVIHEIDGVLELPSVVDHAIFNSDLSELVGAVVATQLVDPLNMATELTIFAPVNQAFMDIQMTVDGLSDSALVDVLEYHVLPTQVRAGAISAGEQNTLQNENITINVTADNNDNISVSITDANGDISNVVLTDVQGTNGVVHVIDRVLIPTL